MRTFIICGIQEGGVSKYVTDLKNHYPNIFIIRNKHELFSHSFTENDTVMVQPLLFTNIQPTDLITLKKKVSFKLIICIHDFVWFHNTDYEFIYLKPTGVPYQVKELFGLADFVIHPSIFTKKLYEFIHHRAVIHPHNDIVIQKNKNIPPIQNKIVIGVPHSFTNYKGKENIIRLMKYTEYKGLSIDFLITGVNTPNYTEENWPDFYSKVHCLLHLNKWGETYCYALSKSLASGLPILYNNIGAFKERIPTAEHYFKVIEDESEYVDEKKLTTTFETMLDYIITNHGKYNDKTYDTTIHYNKLYNFIFHSIPIHIILTSTINVNENKICLFQRNKAERIQTYLKSIQNWLNHTNFYITLVENSNADFPELKKIKEEYSYRFEYITYDEKYMDVYKYKSKGISELFSIRYAYDHSERLKTAKYIIKVTSRYFIPELENYLKTIQLPKYECLVQHDVDRCEMVGARYDCFKTVFNYSTQYDHIEDYYKITASSLKRLVCKKFMIEPTQRGGENEIFTTI